MPERILHRTWSIRTISPFTIPLFGNSAECTDTSDKINGTGNSLYSIEEEATSYMRRQCSSAKIDDDGSYVKFSWVHLLDANDESLPGEENAEIQYMWVGRKRSRSRDFDSSSKSSSKRNSSHLNIDVWVRDEHAAQILLCFPRYLPNMSKSEPPDAFTTIMSPIQAFSFVLLRGSTVAYHPIIDWLVGRYGCVIGNSPFRPSSTDISILAAKWTIMTREKFVDKRHSSASISSNDGTDSSAERGEHQDEKNDTSSSKAKPLEVTFAAPQHIADAGLERITLTVPPLALSNLCNAIQTALVAKKGASNGDAPHENTSGNAQSSSFPILPALRQYFDEAFHIDISTFSLIRAAGSAAALGCDGRIKALDYNMVPTVLFGLKEIVDDRMVPISSVCSNDD